ncbi:hypothetical protein M514_03180 [Trichuris suis]|uniref:Reverse transcriptase domain-containing protein n=1 Tax=Trichuris suis TaxID=68888 RepID=A0A085MFR0_9BILA|nr:hypothetical protein M513_03180 [Trichuris suis]KFD66001.1 hypothetical protein M514_03180 [Trichuris suis]
MGPAKALIPLMAVIQRSKQKVRPVMDFREVNAHIDAFTASSDVCAHKLREWRRQGVNVSILDLKKAYLQVHVEKSLWPYQTVIIQGRRYCLTRKDSKYKRTCGRSVDLLRKMDGSNVTNVFEYENSTKRLFIIHNIGELQDYVSPSTLLIS